MAALVQSSSAVGRATCHFMEDGCPAWSDSRLEGEEEDEEKECEEREAFQSPRAALESPRAPEPDPDSEKPVSDTHSRDGSEVRPTGVFEIFHEDGKHILARQQRHVGLTAR